MQKGRPTPHKWKGLKAFQGSCGGNVFDGIGEVCCPEDRSVVNVFKRYESGKTSGPPPSTVPVAMFSGTSLCSQNSKPSYSSSEWSGGKNLVIFWVEVEVIKYTSLRASPVYGNHRCFMVSYRVCHRSVLREGSHQAYAPL